MCAGKSCWNPARVDNVPVQRRGKNKRARAGSSEPTDDDVMREMKGSAQSRVPT